MKKIILVLIFIIHSLNINSQDKTIIIFESGRPYQSQTYFYSGLGNQLQTDEIKKNWDEGRRITSIAHTRNGWFVVMAKNTGISMQTVQYSKEWPVDWIKEKWDEGYKVTSLSRDPKKWCVVMSKGFGYSGQTIYRASKDKLNEWYRENRDNGYFITDVAYDGTNWTMVMSQTSKIASQGYCWAKNLNDLDSQIRELVWDKSFRIHNIAYGGGSYLIVYGNYTQNNQCSQSYRVDPSDVIKSVRDRWDVSETIAYVGGGYQNTSNYSGKRTGDVYFTNERGQQGSFHFYNSGGNYFARTDLLGLGYGYQTFTRLVLLNETSDSYIFHEARVDMFSGEITYIFKDAPKMIISKNWDKIVVKKVLLGEDMVLNKEISKEEFDKISKSKAATYSGFGAGQNSNGYNDSNDSGSSYVDGPCRYCGGGGGCSSCKGTGLKYNPYSGDYDTCPSCNGNARCFNCRGTGKQATY